jgi:GMP synthase (glutamine-hydrolysing)
VAAETGAMADAGTGTPPWLVVRNVETEDAGLLGDVLRGSGVAVRGVDAFAGAPVPAGAAGLGGVVVLGGPMGVYDAGRYAFLGAEQRLLRAATDAGLPVLGICLGAQLLASAFGAQVRPGRQGKEIGWAPVELTADGRADRVLGVLAGAPPVFHLHGDTFDLPAGAIHLARSARYAQQAFRIGARAYGLQFHLEFTADTIGRLMADPDCRRDLAALGTSSEAILAETPARVQALAPVARRAFEAFLRSSP